MYVVQDLAERLFARLHKSGGEKFEARLGMMQVRFLCSSVLAIALGCAPAAFCLCSLARHCSWACAARLSMLLGAL